MGSSNMLAGMETPGYAATDTKGIQTVGSLKGGRNAAQMVSSDFKKKLESCTAMTAPVTVQATSVPMQDFSMATMNAAQQLPQGIVGILEGFGLLDYQTDTNAAAAETVQTTAREAQASDAANVQQAQISDQFARMLTNEQPGGLAQDAPQQANADAGKYSGSLESTNNQAQPAEAALPPDGDEAAQLLKSKMSTDNVAQAIPAQQGDAPAEKQGVVQPVQPKTSSDGQQAAMSDTPAEPAQTAPLEKPESTQAAVEMPQTTAASAGAEASAATAKTPRADAAQETAQKATPDFVKDNVVRIVDKASASVREGRYEFDVDLKPDFLGKVSIKLTMEGGEIRMHVRTDDLTVKGMFSDQTSSLQNALKEKGIVLSNVDVSYQEPMAAGRESFGQSSNGGGQKREGQAGWSSDRYSGGDVFETITPISELRVGSSVEYLA